jgi:hypothetical protein
MTKWLNQLILKIKLNYLVVKQAVRIIYFLIIVPDKKLNQLIKEAKKK